MVAVLQQWMSCLLLLAALVVYVLSLHFILLINF